MVKRFGFVCLNLLLLFVVPFSVSADNKIIRKKSVRDMVVTSGNRLTIQTGGNTYNTKLLNGGIEDVFSGGVSTNAVVKKGGRLWLAGGKSFGATVEAGGLMEVREHRGISSYAADTKVMPGSRMNVYNNSLAENITVHSGGFLRVYLPKSLINDVTILSGGLLHVWKYGTAKNVYVAPGGILELREKAPVLKGTIIVAGKLKASFNHKPDVSQAKIIIDLTRRNVTDDFCIENFDYLGESDICAEIAKNQKFGFYKLASRAGKWVKALKVTIEDKVIQLPVQKPVLYAGKYYTLNKTPNHSVVLSISKKAPSKAEISAMYNNLKNYTAAQFDLKVCSGKAAYYFAEHDIRLGDPTLKYAVIYIHGSKGGAKDAASLMRKKLKQHHHNKKVYCIAPSFFTKQTCPEDKQKSALIWEGGWRGGSSSVNGNNISNFEVIDRIYQILSNRRLYPQMRRITLVGFSAGGQCVNRYVAVGKMPVSPDIETVFIVGNPSVYLYVDDLRFKDGNFKKVKSKIEYNRWFLGLDNRYPYCEKMSKNQILNNLSSRPTLYFCGTGDVNKKMLDVNRAAMLQGENRYERFLIYQKHVARYPAWRQQTKFFSVTDIAHSSRVFYRNNIAQKWIFGEKLPPAD